MPIYEYECAKCGEISSFMEKMFKQPTLLSLLGFKQRKCKQCGSKKLTKVISKFASKVERTQNETLNELKSMGNVNFTPAPPKPSWGDGPPPGGCPYEKSAKAEQSKKKADRKAKEPIEIR
jgi:putative FmdB family regulatory protein